MNEGLFKKYTEQILSHLNTKQKIINTIKEKTNINLNDTEISIKGKTVSITLSSVKKSALLQKGGKEALESIGYTLKS